MTRDRVDNMDEKQFIEELQKKGITLNETQLNQFENYFKLLVEWNEKVNLTAITEKGEVYLKHFYDSISASFYYDFDQDLTVCDIGAGAGFPSIPLKICFPQLKITIVDSLKKRITFLETLVKSLELSDVNLVHSRAEDFGQNKLYRESFDVVTARAVARTSVLSEYCIPVCKLNGMFIALKGINVEVELEDAKKAINILGAELVDSISFTLPVEKSERSIVLIKKTEFSPKKYPRKAGMPTKSPL